MGHRPSVYFFKRPEYRHEIEKTTQKYKCKLWCHDKRNVFGLFGTHAFDQKCCALDIRIYIQSVAEMDMDYMRCDEVFKSIYFNKTNPSYAWLIKHCTELYGDFQIQYRHCDRSYVWIWSKSKECRGYIKQFIKNDLEHNWGYKYMPLDNSKVSILFGRPLNDKKDANGNITRHHEWSKLFRWDDENKKYYFWNKDNKKCSFIHKYIPDQMKGINHKLCIVVHFKDYDNAKDAKQAMDDVANRIDECLTQNFEIITLDSCMAYQLVLGECFADKFDSSIRFDGDWNNLYVKHDDDGQYEVFRSLLFDRVVPNTIILDYFDNVKDIHIFRRLLTDKHMSDLRFVHSSSFRRMNRHSVIIFDERIQNEEFRNDLQKMIDDIRQNEMHTMLIEKQYIPMVLGPDGCHLDHMLKHCSLDSLDRALIQINDEDGTIHLGGLNKTDHRLQKFKKLVQAVIDGCEMIELSAKEWKYLTQNKSWNVIMLQKGFAKCCLSLQSLTADKMLFYGPRSVKRQILDKIATTLKNDSTP